MIVLNNFFIISPRGDTVIAKSYRTSDDVGAHERSHTEAFFRKVKFWDGIATPGIADSTGLTPTSVASAGGDGAAGTDGGSGSAADGTSGGNGGNSGGGESTDRKGDAPPVFIMPDGLSYIHVKRNGLIFGCSTNRNVSPCTVVEVSSALPHKKMRYAECVEQCARKAFIYFISPPTDPTPHLLAHPLLLSVANNYFSPIHLSPTLPKASLQNRQSLQGLLRHTVRGSHTEELHPTL